MTSNQPGQVLPERDSSKPNTEQGLYRKFDVRRTDGSDSPGGKHADCDYFVLDMTHDPAAFPALGAYIDAIAPTHPQLAEDLRVRYGFPLPEQASGHVAERWITQTTFYDPANPDACTGNCTEAAIASILGLLQQQAAQRAIDMMQADIAGTQEKFDESKSGGVGTGPYRLYDPNGASGFSYRPVSVMDSLGQKLFTVSTYSGPELGQFVVDAMNAAAVGLYAREGKHGEPFRADTTRRKRI